MRQGPVAAFRRSSKAPVGPSIGDGLRLRDEQQIPDHLAPIVERLGLNRSNWVETVRGFGRLFKQAARRSSSLVDAAARRSRRWFQGKARRLEPLLCRPHHWLDGQL